MLYLIYMLYQKSKLVIYVKLKIKNSYWHTKFLHDFKLTIARNKISETHVMSKKV